MASQGHLPACLAEVDRRTGTPHYATLASGALVFVLALWFPLATLAESTSVVTLLVFLMVNLALWRVKGRSDTPAAAFSVPRWGYPWWGCLFDEHFVALAIGRSLFQLIKAGS